jgi:asparagine synthase (glutamine-hydrolysing)
MCGIAGILSQNHPPSEAELRRQAHFLSHRGPDDHGLLIWQGHGVVQTRLSIIDLAGGHQPICSADGRFILVANGEIYNFVELRQELEAEGCVFVTHSDSEMIIHAYAVYGDDFAKYLHGMFAFCLIDKLRNRVILGRDRIGIKPLFYSREGGRLLFASELKGIIAARSAAPQVKAEALLQYLQSQFNTGEATIIQGIQRLPPATTLIFEADGSTMLRPYWSATDVRTIECSMEEALESFAPLIETVMREHVRSDVPCGLFLSGGVDSALLLSLLTRHQEQPVRTFSVGFPDSQMEGELAGAEYIAQYFNSRHTSIPLHGAEVLGRLPLTIWAADDLMRDYASLPTAILAQHAAKELKVVFSGEGGDEAFAGYGRYRKGGFERFFQNLVRPGSGGFRTSPQLNPLWTSRLFGPELRTATPAIRRPFIQAWNETPREWSHLQRCQYTDLTTAMPDNLLVKADRMLMAFGVEGRVPFLDHRIIEFGLSLPDQLKTDRRQGKLFLKRWAEKSIPAEHLYRKKRGFHVPMAEWLTPAFVAAAEGKLLANRGIREWFHPAAVSALCAAQRQRGGRDRELWSLIQFAIWHRFFIDDFGAKPGANDDPLLWL